jgi:protein-tyrosine phosphatase
MPAILFVCTANQFRSPIAAACFYERLSASGAMDVWKIGSAGTWTTAGLPAHPKAIAAASLLGLDLSKHGTIEVDSLLLSNYNLIVVMESNHKVSLETEFKSIHGRIVLLGQLAEIPGNEIPDPAKKGFDNADEVANLIYVAVQKSFSKLVQFATLLQNGYSILTG